MGSKLIKNLKCRFLTLFDLFDLKLTLRIKIEGGILLNFLPHPMNNRSNMVSC